MKPSVLILLFLVGQCMGGEPCSRLAEIIGDVIEWVRYDYDIGVLSNWEMHRHIEEVRDQVKNKTGIDIISASEREEAICQLFRFKKLKQLYDWIQDPTLPPYNQFCFYYGMGVSSYTENAQFRVDFVKTFYSMAKDFATWMHKSGFPNSFPPSGSHEVNVGALQALVDEMEGIDDDVAIYVTRDMLTGLLPIGPLAEWETGHKNRTSVEEAVGWMEDSNNIFTYAGFVKEQNEWFDVGDLKISVGVLGLVRNNYDKILWYEEGLRIFLKSNLLKLDTSDCESNENQIPM